MLVELLCALVGIAGGAIASVAGFGIGSLLIPFMTFRTGAKIAVAAAAIPHLAGTALRLWRLRKDIDRRILWTFGLMNAAGGLAGAVLHSYVQSAAIRAVFGGLLVFAGIAGLSGFAERMHLEGRSAWAAGFVSGGLGGFAGTQGGIRAAAMFGFQISKQAFIATATATALLVDLARTPVYLWMEWREIARFWPLISFATAGVVVGTLVGESILRKIPERVFRKIVSALILVLGLGMMLAPGSN